MAKKRNIETEYNNYILEKFKDEYPNSVPKIFQIDKTIKFLVEFIKQELENEGTVSIYSLGKFKLVKRLNSRINREQYYPKFAFSRHFVLSIREKKGSCTEAEKKEIERKRSFIRQVWDKRKAWLLANKGEIPEAIKKYESKFSI